MALKKRRHPAWGCISLGMRWGGSSIYLGAELGCVITAGVMAGLNKRAEGELLPPSPHHLFEEMLWVDRSTLGVDVWGDGGPEVATAGP